jgi:hypothetical protein
VCTEEEKQEGGALAHVQYVGSRRKLTFKVEAHISERVVIPTPMNSVS